MNKILFLLVMVTAFVACSDDEGQNITGINLDKTSLDLHIDDSYKFKVITTPENMNLTDCIWSSSNPEVVSVQQNGTVYAVSLGNATISVVSSGNANLKSSCTVHVLQVEAESIEIKDTIKLEVQEEKSLDWKILPDNTTFKNIVWSIENSSIASIDEKGKVKGIQLGETKVIATIKDTKISDTCIVKIIPTSVTGIECDGYINVLIGGSDTINVSIKPDYATNKNIMWESMDENIASVINGKVYAKNLGFTTIKVVSEDGGFEDRCMVSVIEIDQLVTATTRFGTEGSTSTMIYSYLKTIISTNCDEYIYINSIILMDENSIAKDAETNIGFVNNYTHKFITQIHTGSNIETFPAEGWKVKIDYTWNGKEYTQTVINKGRYQ